MDLPGQTWITKGEPNAIVAKDVVAIALKKDSGRQ